MDFISTFHSHMRHLILLMGVVSPILAGIFFARKKEIAGWAKMFIRIYVYVLTIQALMGIIQLIYFWSEFEGPMRHRFEHAGIMLVTLGVAHWGMKFMKAPAPAGPRNTLIVTVAVLVLVLLGILLLPQGRTLLGLA